MKKEVYVPLVKLKMVKEKELPYSGERLNSPDKVSEFAMQILEGLDRECLLVVSVNAKCKPVAVEMVAIGSLDSAYVVPREIFKHAVLCNARGILLVHNHPSGDCEPSKADLDTTKRVRKAGEILGIDVFDHVIVGDEKDTYYSLRENDHFMA